MSHAGSVAAARPWTLRLYDRAPLPPVLIGVLLALAYLLVLALLTLVMGRFYEAPLSEGLPWTQAGWWSELVNAVLFGLGPTVLVLSLRGARRDVHDLAPLLPAEAAAAERVTRLAPGRLRLTGVIVGLSGLAFTYLDPGLWANRVRPPTTDPFFLWIVSRHVAMGWIWGRAMYADVSTARAFGALADSLREIDLLDLRRLTPFARRGVRSVLFWMLGTFLFSLFWVAPNPGRANVLSFTLFVGVAAAALLHPLLGIRRRIRAEKDAVLARIRTEIRADQRTLLDGGEGTSAAASRLPALFAAEARTAAAHEWPFDTSTAVRFFLYAALGLGSWVGGALVERLLGGMLQ